MTSSWSRHLLLLSTFTLLTLLAACSSADAPSQKAGADTTKPALLALLSNQTRTVTGDSIVIFGSLSDDGGLKSFSYTLNGGKVVDVMNSLEEQAFSFTVTGLKKGENSIVLTAEDAAGNKASAELKVSVVTTTPRTFPTVEGTWVDTKVVKQVCDEDRVQTLTFIFDAPQESGALAGLWQAVGNNGGPEAAGSFAGTLTYDGKITGTATLSVNTDSSRFDLAFKMADGTVKGSLKGQTADECYGGYESDDTYKETLDYEVSLTPFEDDKFETNNSAAEATEIASDFSAELILQGGDEDWFSFTLDEARLVTFDLGKDRGGYRSALVHLLDAEEKFLRQLQFDAYDDHDTLGLEAGTYYLRVRSERLEHVAYSMNLSTAALPDAAFEPNNTKAQATPIDSGFSSDLYLTLGDEDWFSFTLEKAQLVTLDLGDRFYELRYDFGDGATRYDSDPVIRAFGAGTHYVSVFVDRDRMYTHDGLTLAYTLDFAVTDLPDEQYEPNDALSSAESVQLPFSGTLFTGKGDDDWFAFELEGEQLVTFQLQNSWNSWRSVAAELFKNTGESLGTFSIGDSERLRLLDAGSYRLKLSSDEGFTYTLSLSAETSNDSNFEDNNSREAAHTVTLDFEETDLLVGYGDEDWFTFELAEPTTVRFAFTSNVDAELYSEESRMYLYGSPSTELQSGQYDLRIYTYDYLERYDLSITAE